jgi:hypothetical protein
MSASLVQSVTVRPLRGSSARSAAADCPSFCTTFAFGASGGGENQTTASSSISNVRGQAQAFAALDPSAGLSLPVLKAEAYSSNTGTGSAFATAFAVEGYTYLGGGSGDFTLDITLTGSVSDPTPADLDTTLTATVYVFAEDPFEFISDIGTLIFEYGAVALDSTVLSISGNETNGLRTGAVSFSLAPGESVYLFTRLSADAERELSFADAFSTLTVDFQDPTGLSAASTVPEPTTLLLTGAGLFALAARRRRGRPRYAVRR